MIKDFLLLTIFPGAMALAAATDLFTMTVPNRLALALVAFFFVAAPLAGLGWSDIGLHLRRRRLSRLSPFSRLGAAAGTPSCSPPHVFGSRLKRS